MDFHEAYKRSTVLREEFLYWTVSKSEVMCRKWGKFYLRPYVKHAFNCTDFAKLKIIQRHNVYSYISVFNFTYIITGKKVKKVIFNRRTGHESQRGSKRLDLPFI
jgi:hypothetical protein